MVQTVTLARIGQNRSLTGWALTPNGLRQIKAVHYTLQDISINIILIVFRIRLGANLFLYKCVGLNSEPLSRTFRR